MIQSAAVLPALDESRSGRSSGVPVARAEGTAADRRRLLVAARGAGRAVCAGSSSPTGPPGCAARRWDERDPSANVPSPTALAATWDEELVEELGGLLRLGGTAQGRRRRARADRQPAPHALRGRHFECFSEDPLLTARIGVALRVRRPGRRRWRHRQALHRQRLRDRADDRSTRTSTSGRCASCTWRRSRRSSGRRACGR